VRIAIDEDIPRELTPLFRQAGHEADHVEDIGLKGVKNTQLLRVLSVRYDVLVTGDTNLEHQQNLRNFDLAVLLIRPPRLVIEQIKPLIPVALAALATAPKHGVTTIRFPPKPDERERVTR
jgi:predicted nuclease of predicted toxin-antitoxin system